MMPVMKFSAGYIWPGMFFWDSPNIVNDYSLFNVTINEKKDYVSEDMIYHCVYDIDRS